MIYSYEAKDGTGRTVTGSLDANDERAAVSQVRAMGFFPMRLAPVKGAAYATAIPAQAGVGAAPQRPYQSRPQIFSGRWFLENVIYLFYTGVSARDLAMFYRQFATLINAGVPIYQSLTTLLIQIPNATLKRPIKEIGEHIRQGGKLSDAMGRYPWLFPEFHRAMIIAGEESGQLDVMFQRLANSLEQEYAMRQVIKREMFMPGITLHGMFLLPPLYLMVVQGSVRAYFNAAILPLLQFYGIIIGLFLLTRILSQFKTFFDTSIAFLPAIGKAVRAVALARFARALATLYAAGISVPRAVQFAAAACGNNYLGARIARVTPWMEQGQGVVESMAAARVFPPLVMTMLSTAEMTGSLDTMMNKVGEYYEQESAHRLHQLGVAIGVIMTILIGIRIGIFVIGFYTGQFSNYGDVMNENG